jgi:V8-like Glu-specific endopeptidase
MANAAENEPIGSHCGDRNEFSEEGYWTAERRARARPVPLPKVPMPEARGGEQPATTGEVLPKGPPGHFPGQPPPGYGEKMNLAPHLEPGGDTGVPRVAVEVPHPLNYPYSTVGKLFYTFPNGGKDEGTAAMITPNIALTAGHCIYDKDKGGKAINVEFWPGWGYRKTIDHKTKKQIDDPAYCFKPSYLAWETAWGRDNNFAYDYAMAWIDAAPGSQIGWLGIAWNQSLKNRHWTAVGYPAPSDLVGGTIMYASTGQSTGFKSGVFGLTNDDMGLGSSGGPWFTQGPIGNDTSPYPVNGVQSRGTGPGPGATSSSPYFTHLVWDLVLYISNLAHRRYEPWPPPPRR